MKKFFMMFVVLCGLCVFGVDLEMVEHNAVEITE